MRISICVSLLNFITNTDLHQYHHYNSSYLPLGEQVPHKGLTKKGNGKWQVQIWHECQSRYVGVYDNIAIASSAYRFTMNFVSIKLVTKLEKLSPEDVRADIFALKAFVNKSLKTLLANWRPHHQDKSKGVGGLPVQVGRTHNVSSLGLVLSANCNGCTHQDKGKSKKGLPVQVGRFHNVSSLGLALSSVHHDFFREDTQQSSSFKICSVCARTLPHSDFSLRQHHS